MPPWLRSYRSAQRLSLRVAPLSRLTARPVSGLMRLTAMWTCGQFVSVCAAQTA